MSPHLLYVLRAAAWGVVLGHLARRAAPYLIGLPDRRLPFRWPWLELIGGASFFVAATPAGFSGTLPTARFVLVALLLAATATDVLRKLLPDALTIGGTAVGIAIGAWRPEPLEAFLSQWLTLDYLRVPATAPAALRGAVLAAAGAGLGYALLAGFRWLMAKAAGVDGLGGGDVKLLAMIGAFLGPHAVALSLLPACALGAAAGVVHRLRTGAPHAPFGPALAAGAVITMALGDALLGTVWHLSIGLLRLSTGVLVAFYLFLLLLLIAIVVRLRRRASAYNALLDDELMALEAELETADEPDRDP